MPLWKIRSSRPAWYVTAPRLGAKEPAYVFRDDEPEVGQWDWRSVEVPMSDFVHVLHDDLEEFAERELDEEVDFELEACAAIEAEMKRVGVATYFKQNPESFTLCPQSRTANFFTEKRALAVAYHKFGAATFSAYCAIEGSNRHLPRDRAPAWNHHVPWHAHAKDSEGTRYERELSLSGDDLRIAFEKITGVVAAECISPRRVARLAADCSFWEDEQQDDWIDSETRHLAGSKRAGKVEQLTTACETVIAFLKRCEQIGCEIQVIKGRALRAA